MRQVMAALCQKAQPLAGQQRKPFQFADGRKSGFFVIAVKAWLHQALHGVHQPPPSMNIGIYVFDEMEVLDFAGPYEVLTTAARVQSRLQAAEQTAEQAAGEAAGEAAQTAAPAPLFSVILLGQTTAGVEARAGLRVTPDFTICQHPPLDVLIVPGGVVQAETTKADVVAWIQLQASRVRILASVCTGAFLLARAGCLNGRQATTHWEDLADLRAQFPAVKVCAGVRWVDAGTVMTSAGISAGIDMSLHLVQRLHSIELAQGTARQMDFDWTHNP